jgi:hypothetical protein
MNGSRRCESCGVTVTSWTQVDMKWEHGCTQKGFTFCDPCFYHVFSPWNHAIARRTIDDNWMDYDLLTCKQKEV